MRVPLLAVLLLFVSARALAAWVPGGAPVTGPEIEYENLTLKGIAPDGQGGAYVLVFSDHQPPSSYVTYASRVHRLDALGNLLAGWPVTIDVNQPKGATVAYLPDDLIAGGSSGVDAVLMGQGYWSGEPANVLRRIHVQSNGTFSPWTYPGWPASPPPHALAYADAGPGEAFVAFSGPSGGPCCDPPPPPTVAAVRLNPVDFYGAWTVILDEGYVANGIAVLGEPSGGCYVLWSGGTAGADVRLQRLLDDGSLAPGWPANGLVVCDAAGVQVARALAPAAGGGVYAAWEDDRDGLTQIYVSRVDAVGTISVEWPEDGLALGAGATGERLGQLASDGAGGILVCRAVQADTHQDDVRLLRIDASGLAHPGWPGDGVLLNADPYPMPWGSDANAILPDGNGGAFAAYRSDARLFARHVLGDGSSAGGGALLSANGYKPRLVRSGEDAIAVWETYDGSGIFASLLPAGQVGVEPRTPSLGAVVSPNPASGPSRVSFSLPRGGPARIDVVDLAGRRVASRDVDGVAGAQSIALPETATLAAGVYVVRIRSGAQESRVRLAVVR